MSMLTTFAQDVALWEFLLSFLADHRIVLWITASSTGILNALRHDRIETYLQYDAWREYEVEQRIQEQERLEILEEARRRDDDLFFAQFSD